VAVEALAAHLAAYPAGRHGLVFANTVGDPWRHSTFGTMWRRTSASAGVQGRTCHDLRHFYASLLIRHGESVKTVQAWLGHASAAETLDTYSHLWPDSEERTREAVDLALGAEDSLRTEAAT
jgi:integrase